MNNMVRESKRNRPVVAAVCRYDGKSNSPVCRRKYFPSIYRRKYVYRNNKLCNRIPSPVGAAWLDDIRNFPVCRGIFHPPTAFCKCKYMNNTGRNRKLSAVAAA
jgi:hypothetical protein